MIEKLFTKSMKLADLIDSDCRLLYVLPRFGMKLGFGDITIEDMCKKHNVIADVFILICNIYAFEEYVPKISDADKVSLISIIAYLKQSHADYRNKRIPHIIEHIENFAAESDSRQSEIIKQFCENYRSEVIEHLNYEEKTVFPYIESLVSGNNDDIYKIEDYLHNHDNIDDKLHDLKSIVLKYIEPKDDESGRDLLIDIYLLEEDLKRHTIIEEKILAALVEIIELNKR